MLEYFSHGIIRKAIISFGTLFNDIYITRKTTDGTELERFKIPLSYGPKQKFIVRNDSSDPNLVRNFEISLPRMGFEIVGLKYDYTRKISTISKVFSNSNTSPETGIRNTFVHVPYDLSVTLHVMSKNTEDVLQIIEQILPYFTPDYSLTIDNIALNNKVEVPVSIAGIQFFEPYEGDFEERKAFICSISFIMRLQIIGPIKEAKIIRTADVSFYDRYSFDAFLNGATSYNLLETVSVSVTGGATAGSFGPTGTYQINITGPYG